MGILMKVIQNVHKDILWSMICKGREEETKNSLSIRWQNSVK